MAITVGNVSVSTGQTNPTTISHNNNGDYLLVDIACGYSQGGVTTTSVTYNGTAMNQLAVVQDGGGFAQNHYRYSLVAPTSGTHNVVVTDSANYVYKVISVRSFSGVHQTVPEGTTVTNNGGIGTSPTVTVSSASGELVVDSANVSNISGDVTLTVGAGQTQDSNNTNTGLQGSTGGTSHEAGAASVIMTWTPSGLSPWSSIGTPLKPSGGVVVVNHLLTLMGLGT